MTSPERCHGDKTEIRDRSVVSRVPDSCDTDEGRETGLSGFRDGTNWLPEMALGI